MGFIVELSFCEVCGKKIPSGKRFCEKHVGSKEVEEEFSEDREEEEDEDIINKEDPEEGDDKNAGEVFGIF